MQKQLLNAAAQMREKIEKKFTEEIGHLSDGQWKVREGNFCTILYVKNATL